MTRLKSKSIASLLKNKNFSHLQTELTRLDRYTLQLRALLPDAMAPHCQVVKIQHGSISIAVDNSAWLAKLRFLTPKIKQLYRQQYHLPLTQVKLLVSRPVSAKTGQPNQSKKRKLSQISARYIHDYADSLESSDLKQALLRLVRQSRH